MWRTKRAGRRRAQSRPGGRRSGQASSAALVAMWLSASSSSRTRGGREGLAPGLGRQRRRGRLGERQARGERAEGGGEVGHAGQMGMIRHKAGGA